jgi:hypothetical protein
VRGTIPDHAQSGIRSANPAGGWEVCERPRERHWAYFGRISFHRLDLRRHVTGQDCFPSSVTQLLGETVNVSIQITPYTEEFTDSVADFNRRVAPANVTFSVPVTPVPCWLPKRPDRSIHREMFLAVEDRRVRGAYTLKLQEFLCGGAIRTVGSCQMPISEGIVDKRYGLVGIRIMEDALRRQPLAYDLGIGSFDAPIALVHRAMGWSFRDIPFFFRIENGFRFSRNIEYLRTDLPRRLGLDAAAFLGVAGLAATLAHRCYSSICALRNGGRARKTRSGPVFAESFAEFGCWADDIWNQCLDHYSIAGVRNAEILNILYPPEHQRFIRVRVIRRDSTIGWAILLNTHMQGNKYFGNMRVGSIVDCLSVPGEEDTVIAEAARILKRHGVDLAVTNQSHASWRNACRSAGFIQGPSNYVLGTSKEFSALLEQSDPKAERIHITRGDGDGPIHL